MSGDYEFVEIFESFYRDYYREEIGELADRFPSEQRSLYISAKDVYRSDPDLLDDWLNHYDRVTAAAEEALAQYDLPVSVDLSGAMVRLTDPDGYLDHRSVTDLSAADDIGADDPNHRQESETDDGGVRVPAVWVPPRNATDPNRCTRTARMYGV